MQWNDHRDPTKTWDDGFTDEQSSLGKHHDSLEASALEHYDRTLDDGGIEYLIRTPDDPVPKATVSA